MDEFEKIKTFSESLAERQQKLDSAPQEAEPVADLPKYLSQFRAVPVQEEKESKRLLWIVLALSVVIIAVVIFALTKRLPEMEESKIIEIRPTETPVKVLPENPGGLTIPDKDKVVYNRAAESTPAPVVENLFPEIEQPVLPAEVIEPENKEEVVLPPIFSEDTQEVVEVLKEEPVVQDINTDQVVIENQQPEVQEEIALEVIEEKLAVPQEKPKEVVAEKKIEKPAPKAVEKEKTKPTKAVPAAEQKTKSSKPVWRAQLLSSASKEKVESSWKIISKQHVALLSDMPYQIISATIPGKGTFWRLQVGEFSTKEMVVNLCTKLKKKKQECIPVK